MIKKYANKQEQQRASQVRFRIRNPERYKLYHRKKHLNSKYGISVEEFQDMLLKQKGLCLVCEKPETVKGRNLAVDHCHETGKIRGLLCMKCNITLGKVEDNPELLRKLADYLEKQ